MDFQILKDELKRYIGEKKVIAVVGTGVSVAVTKDDRASWPGFLKEGLKRCRQFARVDAEWLDIVQRELDQGKTENLLHAAERISKALEAPSGNRYVEWLRETFETLEPKKPDVLRSLVDLQIPIATTNYDSLIEKVSGGTLKPLIWNADNTHVIQRILSSDERGYVLHLHGHWEDALSVVLGIADYQRHLDNTLAQFVQQSLAATYRLVFIGCGAGLSDPNFEKLLSSMRELLGRRGHAHYRLALDRESQELQAGHDKAGDNIVVVSYGSDYEELPAFLASLAPAPMSVFRPSLPRVPPYFQDRDAEVEQVVGALLEPEIRPIPITGGPGMGKTAVARKVLHDKRIAEKYGERRYFVRCEGEDSPDKLMKAIARALHISESTQIEQKVREELIGRPALLVLDGADAAWFEHRASVEEYFSSLAEISDLALIGTLRGLGHPPGWHEKIQVDKLEARFAKSMFLAIAGRRFEHDKWLEPLLKDVEYVPLSVNVLAFRAQKETGSLEKMREDWRTNFYDLAQLDDEMKALYASFRTVTRRMSDNAKKLLAFLGVLPGGIAHDDLNDLLPGGLAASYDLRNLGLAVEEENRLRAYPPVREFAKAAHAPDVEGFKRLSEYYIQLAQTYCARLGRPEAGHAIRLLDAENANIETVLIRGLAEDAEAAKVAIDAAVALAKLTLHAGIGGTEVPGKRRDATKPRRGTQVLRQALEVAERLRDQVRQALVWQRLGDIAQLHADYAEAGTDFDQALTLFSKKPKYRLKVAECIKSLGDVDLHFSNFPEAQKRFQDARQLYMKANNKNGEAECFKRMGDIAREKHLNDDAKSCYEKARELYEQTEHRDVLGYANCIKAIADVQVAFGKSIEANKGYWQASRFYESVHDVLGIANCCLGFADVARKEGEYPKAKEQYDKALEHFQRLENSLCIASCYKGLGEMEWKLRRFDTAAQHYSNAARFYANTGNRKGHADCTKSRGDLELDNQKYELAEVYFDQAYDLYRALNIRMMMVSCLKGRADIATKRADYDAARKLYEEARDGYRHAEQERDDFGEAHCLLSFAALEMAVGAHESAKTLCLSAIPIFDKMHDWDGLGDCYIILGEAETHLNDPDSKDAALAAFLKAAQAFQGHDNGGRKEKAERLAAAINQASHLSTAVGR